MANYHNEILMELFPDQCAFGVDYGNIEFKESTKHYHKFTVEPKDNDSEFFVFYDHEYEEFYMCRTKDLPYISKKRSFRVAQVKKNCMWWTRNKEVVKAFVEFMKRE